MRQQLRMMCLPPFLWEAARTFCPGNGTLIDTPRKPCCTQFTFASSNIMIGRRADRSSLSNPSMPVVKAAGGEGRPPSAA